ncbi:hypothetical protein EDD11_009428 [Mortierella claussenii]|nr:hypothetical protein EDD11_009428 [Mortierella claussenii]
MLGRNAARPLSVTPARIAAMTSHRLSQWMLARPYTMLHMHRFLFLTPQLLLTNAPNTKTATTSASAVVGAAPGHGPVSSLHTSSTNSAAAAAAVLQPQLAHEILLPADLYTPDYPYNSTAVNEETAKPSTSTSTPSTVAAASANNVIAFNYLLAASWHPKSQTRQQLLQQKQQQLLKEAAAANAERTLRWKEKLRAAHPGKVDAGEDAFFHVSTPSRVALGVADGVGGWSEMGVDPALFSWALMNNAENIARLTDNIPPEAMTASSDADVVASTDDAVRSAVGGERKILDAQSILDGAYSELVQSGTVEAGSSTACILSLCKMTGTLRASNLGDSAFLLIRNNQCIYESPSQQHFWNCPYQLTVLPPTLRQQQQRESGINGESLNESHSKQNGAATTTTPNEKKTAYVQDLPKDAVQTTHQLQDGDVIVLATDGFWDNVFTKEAIELVDRELGDIIRQQQQQHQLNLQESKPQQDLTSEHAGDLSEMMTADEILARVRALSKRLTNTARRFSLDAKRMTPFSQGARHIRCGGKIDDITVIVTLVRSTIPRPLQ